MVQKVGSIGVDFKSNVAKFQGDMGRAASAVSSSRAKVNTNLGRMQSSFDRINKRAKTLSKRFLNFRTVMGTLVGSAGLGLFTKNALEAADAIGKTADSANISTKKLQELRFAGDLYGASTRDIDDALKRFNRRLGVFIQDGSGPAAKAFEELGIKAVDASGNIKSTETVLDEAIAELSQYENMAKIAATASRLFGEDAGPRLANLIAAGREEMQKLARDARELGIIMDEKMIRSAEDAKDKITVLSSIMSNKLRIAVVQNAEAIANFTQKIIDVIPNMVAFGKSITAFTDVFKQPINNTLEDFTNNFLEFLGAAEKSKADTLFDMSESIQSMNDAFAGTSSAMRAQNDMNKLLEDRRSLISELSGKGNKGGQQDVNSGQDEFVETTEEMKDGLKDVERTAEDTLSNIGRSIEDTALSGKFRFNDMVNSIQQDLARLLIRQSVTKPLVDTFGGFLAGGISSAAGDFFGGGSAAASTVASVPTPTATAESVPGRAIGGAVNQGQPFMVGERGPEMFVPSQSGQIVPNGGGGSGGVTVNQTIQLSAGVPQAVQGELRRMMPEIQKATTSGVVKAIDRGGIMARKVGAKS